MNGPNISENCSLSFKFCFIQNQNILKIKVFLHKNQFDQIWMSVVATYWVCNY